MPRQNKDLRPKLDLEAEALAALEEARTMPPDPERNDAMKASGHSAECRGLAGHIFLPSAEDLANPKPGGVAATR
jgi:hypothetical protein